MIITLVGTFTTIKEQKGATMAVGLRAGRPPGDIAMLNKLPRSLCYRIKRESDTMSAAVKDP